MYRIFVWVHCWCWCWWWWCNSLSALTIETTTMRWTTSPFKLWKECGVINLEWRGVQLNWYLSQQTNTKDIADQSWMKRGSSSGRRSCWEPESGGVAKTNTIRLKCGFSFFCHPQFEIPTISMDFSRWKFCNFSGLNLGKGGFRQISFQTNSSENFQTGHLKVHIICSHFVFKVKTSGGFNAILSTFCKPHKMKQHWLCHTWLDVEIKLDPDTSLQWEVLKHINRDATTVGQKMQPANRQKNWDRQINFGRENSTKDTENWIGLAKTELNSLTAV